MLAAPKRLRSARVPQRVQFPASRRKTLFGETPNNTRGDAYAPQTPPKPWPLSALFGNDLLRDALEELRTVAHSHIAANGDNRRPPFDGPPLSRAFSASLRRNRVPGAFAPG